MTLTDSADAFEFSEIDHEIQNHLDALHRLRTRRNEKSITHRIPPEILSHIFVCYMHILLDDIYFPPPHFPTDPPHPPGSKPRAQWLIEHHPVPWIVVSYISFHWRSVALSNVALWNTIFLGGEPWTKELIVRSKDALLYVRSDPRVTNETYSYHRSRTPAAWQSSLLKVIRDAGDRIVSLNIPVRRLTLRTRLSSWEEPSESQMLSAIRTTGLRALKRLNLRSNQSGSYSVDANTGHFFQPLAPEDEWPSTFLREIISKPDITLCSLSLHGFHAQSWMHTGTYDLLHFSWSDSLTTLKMSNANCYPPNILADILGRLCMLEELELQLLYQDERTSWDVDTSITLPSLKSLSLLGFHATAIASFIEALQVPLDVQISLGVSSGTNFRGPGAVPEGNLTMQPAVFSRLFISLARFIYPSSGTHIMGKGKGRAVRPYQSFAFVHDQRSLCLGFSRYSRIPALLGPWPYYGDKFPFRLEHVQLAISFDCFTYYGPEIQKVLLENVKSAIQNVEHTIFFEAMDGFELRSYGDWIGILARLEHVKEVEARLTMGGQNRLFRALDPLCTGKETEFKEGRPNGNHGEVEEGGHENDLFPLLDHLTLHNARLIPFPSRSRSFVRPSPPSSPRNRGNQQDSSDNSEDDSRDPHAAGLGTQLQDHLTELDSIDQASNVPQAPAPMYLNLNWADYEPPHTANVPISTQFDDGDSGSDSISSPPSNLGAFHPGRTRRARPARAQEARDLPSILASRQERDVGIKRLTLVCTSRSALKGKRVLSRLRTVVPTVEWDASQVRTARAERMALPDEFRPSWRDVHSGYGVGQTVIYPADEYLGWTTGNSSDEETENSDDDEPPQMGDRS